MKITIHINASEKELERYFKCKISSTEMPKKIEKRMSRQCEEKVFITNWQCDTGKSIQDVCKHTICLESEFNPAKNRNTY